MNDDEPSGSGAAHLVLVIGASAGGLAAIGQFLEALGDAPIAAVVVMHLAPDRRSHLTELLARHTPLEVVVAGDRMRLAPGRIHVAPPGVELEVSGEHLLARPRPPDTRVPRPIDRLLRSMAEPLGERVIGLILSGTGADGALGLRTLQRAGGLTLAQSPDEAEFRGMPQSAARLGGVDRVLPIADLAALIKRWIATPETRQSDAIDVDGALRADPYDAIVSYAGATLHRDLRIYKPTTVRRRILRRMALLGIEHPEDYLVHLGQEPAEAQRLAEQLLVEVTAFFRDRTAFDALDAALADPIEQAGGAEFRVWVPGCATGEEAYSIAMLLAERLGGTDFQIFATDLSLDAVRRARLGRYPAAAVEPVPPALLERWFVTDGDDYLVQATLRNRVTFAQHDLIFDPPFSRMHLVSCRNLLIYLEPAAQLKAFQLMHFALRPGGLLFLGAAENLPPNVTRLFEPIDRPHRLFRPRPDVGGQRVPAMTPRLDRWRPTPRLPVGPSAVHRNTIERLILERAIDAAALVDDSLTVLYTHGRIDQYLRYPQGLATTGLTGALPPAASARVRAAIRAVFDGEQGRLALELPGHGDGRIQVQVVGATQGTDRRVLLCFEPCVDGAEADPGDPVYEAELHRFEQELDQLVEQLQTSNEDLRTSQEELLSMNEELQSSNEELETSKEELQSLNEELTTVNAQLQGKLAELEEANADLSNFVAAGRIPALFLDAGLRIRRFTPETRRLFRLVPGDVGRPLSDIRHELVGVDIDAALNRALETDEVSEREARTRSDEWFRLRIVPYRLNEAQAVTGVMLTLVDVTEQKRQAREAQAFRRRLSFAIEGSAISAFTQDAELRYLEIVNPAGAADAEGLVGVTDDDIDFGPEGDALRDFKRRVLATGTDDRATFRLWLPGEASPRTFDVRARRTPQRPYRLMVVAIDITDAVAREARRHQDTERRISRELSKNYLESLGLLAGGVAHDFNNHLMVMQASVELLRDEAPEIDAELDDFDRAMEASRTLIAQILTFAQPDSARGEALSVGRVVEHTIALIRPVVPLGVELRVQRGEGADTVRGVFSKLQQVITNLVHNAIHAMPEGGVVEVGVYTRLPWVVVDVRDTGVGIPPDRLGRVFEPFFTTRDRGRGSGMGLAVVHGVVRGMGGRVEVDSEVGVGSTFTVHLPLVEGAAESRPALDGRAAAQRGAGQRVAVVDDEEPVARLLERMLRGRGFTVERFTSGPALVRALGAGARFDAVVSDVRMPDLDGPATVRAAREIVPDLKALLLSGYAEVVSGDGPDAPPARQLTKPVTTDQLVEALCAVLAEPPFTP